jgi:hypothetical protein
MELRKSQKGQFSRKNESEGRRVNEKKAYLVKVAQKPPYHLPFHPLRFAQQTLSTGIFDLPRRGMLKVKRLQKG